MHNSDLEQASMNIILHAGNARTYIMEALDKVGDADFEECDKLVSDARASITKAHEAQTTIIQQMIDKENTYSILFSHAQDTLMSIMTEVNLSEKIIQMMRNVYTMVEEKK